MTLGDQLRFIVNKMKSGAITYEEARIEAAPLIKQMNAVMKERAKEAGVPFRKISFEAFAR